MNEFNRRWGALNPFTDMKVFSKGVSHLTQMNAYEYRDMMKGIVVVMRGASLLYSIIIVYHRL
jgi:hypothetical protein